MSVSAELPKYQCHKKVWALKIKMITFNHPDQYSATEAEIIPEEEGFAPFVVDQQFLNKHNPKIGGYYVVYDDGYKSFSPAEAFESGYTRI